MSKLDVYEFGRRLLDTNDLDPVYVVLHHAKLSRPDLYRWLLAYWCFYHSGTASYIVDDRSYWGGMVEAGTSKAYPRCHERRHFRGENARKSIEYLMTQGVDSLFSEFQRAWYENQTLTVQDVMEYVQEWVGFGPWISFKVADMLERLDICKVRFDDGAMFLFDSPRDGAIMLWEMEHGVGAKPGEAEGWAVKQILNELGPIKAPPRYERTINAQEAETVLCKWKSYMRGHYVVGEDIKALRSGLLRFAKCKTSQRLLKAGRSGGLW